MKHLTGKQKNNKKQQMKKTPQKPGFSNSRKNSQIRNKNLRSRNVVINESITRCMRSSMVENRQSTDNQNTLNTAPAVVFRSTECYTGLNTFRDKAVTFLFENGFYDIFVEDLLGNEERGKLPLVILRPRPSNIDLHLHSNGQNDLELHKYENQNSNQGKKFFILHSEGPGFVSFECLCPRGLYIGVKQNRLELMTKKEDDEAFMFRLTK
ncbi:interleukin-33 isoform X2 [Macrotis lagotis]|uniref:interleukin-33 isoform X2 n=1 Tax=Macrotis lagotis TaxID=92651 RepID=UPI003D69A039